VVNQSFKVFFHHRWSQTLHCTEIRDNTRA